MKKRIGLIGAGNRTKDYNLPILELLSDDLEIVGVTTKSGKLRDGLESITAPVFSSITTMVEETSPDVLIVSIKSSTVEEVLDEVVSTDVPFLIETTDNYAVYSKLAESGAKASILEQWPFLPLEQFKKAVINSQSSPLGQIVSVENDYRTYDYHGAAQLRNYLPGSPKLISLKALQNNYRSEFYVDKSGQEQMPALERIRAKIGLFENGTMLVYKFSDRHKNMPFRNSKALKVVGSKGSITGDCLLDGGCEISVLDDEGRSHNLEIFYRYTAGHIGAISCTLPSGELIEWENEFGDLSEHQLATAHLLKETLVNENTIYSVDDAVQDMILSYGGE